MSLMTVYHGSDSYGRDSGFLFESGVTFRAFHFDFTASSVQTHQTPAAGAAEISVFLAHLLAGKKCLDLKADIAGPFQISAVFFLALGKIFGEDPEQGIDFSCKTDQDGQRESKHAADEGDQDTGHECKQAKFIHTVPACHETGQPDAEPVGQRA